MNGEYSPEFQAFRIGYKCAWPGSPPLGGTAHSSIKDFHEGKAKGTEDYQKAEMHKLLTGEDYIRPDTDTIYFIWQWHIARKRWEKNHPTT